MMNLRDHIRLEIERGALSTVFKAIDVKKINSQGDDCVVGAKRYSKLSVNQILANHSIGPGERKGESVKRGGQILFAKHDRGRYSLIEDVESDDTEPPAGTPIVGPGGPRDRDAIAASFVTYLREKPFRLLRNSKQGPYWYPPGGSVEGWIQRLHAYEWNGKGWGATVSVVSDFERRLSQLRGRSDALDDELEEEAHSIYADVRAWGNPRGAARDGSFVLARLREAWGRKPSIVDSTLTKLYAFASPETFVIYDSRVATAIVSIAEDIYRPRMVRNKREETVDTIFHMAYPALGRYPGSGGTRPRALRWSGWPDAYRSVEAQCAANDLCSRIAKLLRRSQEGGRDDWSLREVEAVLFMEGY